MPVTAPESEPEEQSNEFANPDSVNLEPDQDEVNAQVARLFEASGLGDDLSRRVGRDEQTQAAPGAPNVPGKEELFPAGGPARNPHNKDGGEKKENWLTRRIRESRAKGQQSLANIAQAQAKAKAKQIAKKELWAIIGPELIAFFAATWWIWLILALLIIIIAFVVFFVIARSLRDTGDPASKTFGIGLPGGLMKTPMNPEGTYLKIMTDKYVINDKKNVPRTIQVESTAGRIAEEEAVSLKDKQWCYPRSCLYFNTSYDPKSHNQPLLTADEAKFYVTMRFPFMSYVQWPAGGHKNKPVSGLGPDYLYAGRRIIVYNKKTQKAVVGIAAEWGPAPAAGVCTFKDGGFLTTTTNLSFNGENACAEEGKAWNDPARQSDDPKYVTPPDNFTGRIMGAPKAVMDAIGAQGDDIVIVGFAKDQNMTPGQVISVTPDMLATEGPAVNGALNVPGVEEGDEGQCGMASINMVALYYLSNHGAIKPDIKSLPEKMQPLLEPPEHDNAWFKVNPDKSSGTCVTPDYLNTMGRGVPSGWEYVKVGDNDKNIIVAAERSVKSGNPVVVYTKAGGMFSTSRHIYVLVGYDDSSGEFIVNNPNIGRVDIQKKGGQMDPPKPAQTVDHLFEFRGDLDKGNPAKGWGPYGHTFIMLKDYVK